MCGIVGVVGSVDKRLLRRMMKIMEHRGPDDSGTFIDTEIGLGNQRLSIIDVKGGKQPIHNEDSSVWVVFNGEIYNFLDLRKSLEKLGHEFYTNSDTEVIVHAYEEFGKDFVKKFNGMFAIAIWDSNERTVILARDRLGIKPLYYTMVDGNFVFTSEIKSLLLYPGIKRKIDWEAFRYFLTLRYVPAPYTMFKHIFKLEPGHILTLKEGKIGIKRYWKLVMNPRKASDEFYFKRFVELLKDSVRRRLISEVPLGAYLSGGIDSSSVVAIMSVLSEEPVKTFSVGFGEERADELSHAKLVSEILGTEHHEFIVEPNKAELLPKIVWHFDEPVADPAAIPVYLLSKLAKRYVTVVLTGEGGDELFAGYEQYKIICNAEKFKRLAWIGKEVLSIIPTKFLDSFFKFSSSLGRMGIERARSCLESIDKDVLKSYLKIVSIFDDDEALLVSSEKIRKRIRGFSVYKLYKLYFKNSNKNNRLNTMLLLETEIQLPDNFLMKTDKMTMAGSIEARVPFLDHRFVEFAASLPQNLKLRWMEDKYITRRVMSKLFPLRRIMKRKKHRFFVPIDSWLKGELWDVVQQVFSEENVKRVGILNYRYIQHIFRNFNESPLYYARQLWSLLTFEVWRKMFIEGERVKL